MFEKIITNYNMSFLKEILLEKGKNCWDAGVDRWGYQIEGEYGYGFYAGGGGDKIRIEGSCSINLTLEATYDDGKIIWQNMNIEIAGVGKQFEEFYVLKIRLKDYKTYGIINLESQGYKYEGEIDNKILNKFVKSVKEMYDRYYEEWENIPKARSGFQFL